MCAASDPPRSPTTSRSAMSSSVDARAQGHLPASVEACDRRGVKALREIRGKSVRAEAHLVEICLLLGLDRCRRGTVDGPGAELSVEADLPDEGARQGGGALHGCEAPRPVQPLRLWLLRLLAHREPLAGVA